MTQADTTPIADPLARRHFTPDAGVGGQIKTRPEDFIVEELPLYEPCGAGEHLYLRIRKRGVSHGELMSCLRRHFGVPEAAIGYAGMKDKLAITSQTISVLLPDDAPALEPEHERIDVLWSARHGNKIRRGHLAGNRFSIRIRGVDPVRTPAVLRILRRLEQTGVPGYFGRQRFGYRRNNHRMGARLLHEDWTGALAELLGTTGSEFPPHQRERRELFDAGRFAEAAAHWTTADRAELIAINALCRGSAPRAALLRIGRTTLNFWVSALASAVFNRILDRRIADATVDRLLDGDLAWKHDSRAVFAVTAETLAGEELAGRLARLEISPSGPLWGAGMTRAAGATDRAECAALDATGVSVDRITNAPFRADGGRRPFRVPMRNVDAEGGFDEHGPFIRVAFDLPRGIYATVVLREVMKEATERRSDVGEATERLSD